MERKRWCVLWIFLLLEGSMRAQLYRLPEIPQDITVPAGRADYLMLHYWDHFRFTDTSWLSQKELVEQAFVDFLQIRPHASAEAGEAGMIRFLNQALLTDSLLFAFFTELSDKYLYDPDSPMYDEETYIPVLRYICSSPGIGMLDKVLPQYQLESALKNRVGNVAADFTYVLAGGEEKTLSALPDRFTLLFFNDPDCERCQRIKKELEDSRLLWEKLMGQLTILAVYTGDEPDIWRQEWYPASWINGCDACEGIHKKQLYDLRVMPALYLLDGKGKVILKNTSVSAVEEFFFMMDSPMK